MLIEIERSGWETFINLTNHLCRNKRVTLNTFKNNQEVMSAREEFLSVETYLHDASGPLLAIILGEKGTVVATYFIKSPTKVILEQKNKEITSLTIETKDSKTKLSFAPAKQPNPQVYHQDLKIGQVG